MDNARRLHPLSLGLHWLVALCVIGLIGVGIFMVRTEAWSLYHWHKSIGLLAFTLILARVIWRLRNGMPAPLGEASPLVHLAARAAHWALLLLTVLLPVSGMLFSGASGHGFGVFSLSLFPHQYDPAKLGEAIPFNAPLAEAAQLGHQILGYTLAALIALHVLAALKHHLLDRDGTLRRMLGQQVS